jgi:hypothetical protein
MTRYEIQFLNGSSWQSESSYGDEQGALVQGEWAASAHSNRKYRMVLCEGSRQTVIHIF